MAAASVVIESADVVDVFVAVAVAAALVSISLFAYAVFAVAETAAVNEIVNLYYFVLVAVAVVSFLHRDHTLWPQQPVVGIFSALVWRWIFCIY